LIAIALTGGIGSGKSAVSSLLAERGAVVLDLDVIAREVVGVGTPGYEAVVACFGSEIVAHDGNIDREQLASIVFEDAEQRRALERIVHPAVASVMAERLAEEAATDNVVIIDIPLLAESEQAKQHLLALVNGVLVVDAPIETAIERLVRLRGLTEKEARARIAAQATRQERLQLADFVILNNGTMKDLGEMSARAWTWMLALKGAA
jgi:dephospho-CoA kinase